MLNIELLRTDGLNDREIAAVETYMVSHAIDTTAVFLKINDACRVVCKTAALAIQAVKPDVVWEELSPSDWQVLRAKWAWDAELCIEGGAQ